MKKARETLKEVEKHGRKSHNGYWANERSYEIRNALIVKESWNWRKMKRVANDSIRTPVKRWREKQPLKKIFFSKRRTWRKKKGVS